MKKILLIGAVIGSTAMYAQTNRINHFSHSGAHTTLNIFKANDNMGLGCGEAFKKEYMPGVDTTKVFWDSTEVDSNKVCTPKPPMDGIKAINPKTDTSKIYNRGPK